MTRLAAKPGLSLRPALFLIATFLFVAAAAAQTPGVYPTIVPNGQPVLLTD